MKVANFGDFLFSNLMFLSLSVAVNLHFIERWGRSNQNGVS